MLDMVNNTGGENIHNRTYISVLAYTVTHAQLETCQALCVRILYE